MCSQEIQKMRRYRENHPCDPECGAEVAILKKRQGWQFIAIRDKSILNELSKTGTYAGASCRRRWA
jgi:hypothetical protein